MKKTVFEKTLKRSNELYIQFTEDELQQLNLSENDKLSWEVQEDGSCLLKKFATIDLDMSEWDRSTLEFLIKESVEKDISVNQVITDVLEKFVETDGAI
jgi:hypothetical protein